MKSLGKRADGLRLERMQASPMWAGAGFRNIHPTLPGLRDKTVAGPTIREFLSGGERRTPVGTLPALNPLDAWLKKPDTGLRATWLGQNRTKP